MADFETRVRVTAKPSGFEKIPQEAAKLKGAQQGLTQGFQAANKAAAAFQTTVDKAFKAFQTKKAKGEVQGLTEIIKDLEDQLSDTAGKQLELQRAMLETEKGTEVYKKLTDEMKQLDDQSSQVQKTIGMVTRAFKEQIRTTKEAADAARAARGAFTQGFAQGAGVGEYMQRGPGMWRQAAGRMAGRALVGVPGGVGRGLAMTPFSGAGGMAQALQAVPFLGALAGPMQAALGFGQSAVAFQQQRLQMAPFLYGGAGARAIAGARAAGEKRADRTAAEHVEDVRLNAMLGELPAGRTEEVLKNYTKQKADERFKRDVQRGYWRNAQGEVEIPDLARRTAEDMAIGEAGGPEAARQRAEVVARQIEGMVAESDAKKGLGARRAAAGRRAAGRARQKLGAPVTGAGLELGGLTAQESLQFAGTVSQRGGGGLAELQQTGLLRAGMAAQTAFGVGPEVTGAMLGATRRGGVVGGAGGDQMASMIGDAMKLGLQGSEITDYLEQMAEGITQWQQTGIPLNPESIREVSGAFAGMGLGITQGRRVGAGVQARAAGIATGGPQTAVDMLLMQSLGGFKGGGIEEFQAARKKMAGGEFGAEQIQDLMKTLTTATGGGAAGEAALQAVMGQLGVTATPQMAEQLLAAGRGGPMGPEQQAAIEQFRTEAAAGAAGAPKGAQGLEALAKDFVETMGPNLKRQASIQNQQLAIGEKLVPAMQSFEQATTTTAKSFAELAPQITKIAEAAGEIATMLPKAARWLNEKIEGSGGVGVP